MGVAAPLPRLDQEADATPPPPPCASVAVHTVRDKRVCVSRCCREGGVGVGGREVGRST